MGIEFEFFKAGNGDSILVSTYNKKDNLKQYKTHILIDGGYVATYKDTIKKRLKKKGIDKLDLVVATHIDQDHICGLLAMIREYNPKKMKIDNIWFNTCNIEVPEATKEKAGGQGIYFKKLINDNGITHNDNVFLSDENLEYHDVINNEISLTLLSPYEEDIDELKLKNKNEVPRQCGGKEAKEKCGKSCKDIRDIESVASTFKEVLRKNNDKPLETDTIENRSSIAFILKYNQESYLFLGDSSIEVINRSLEELKYSKNNRLKVKFVKLSHHGSKNNINNKFLDIVQTNKFVILTNCKRHQHPDKETLSLILTHDLREKDINFIFNYKDIGEYKFSTDNKKIHDFEAFYKDILEF